MTSKILAPDNGGIAQTVSNGLLKFLPYCFGLYIVAVLTTMAGMEMFGWLTGLVVLLLLICNRGFPKAGLTAELRKDAGSTAYRKFNREP